MSRAERGPEIFGPFLLHLLSHYYLYFPSISLFPSLFCFLVLFFIIVVITCSFICLRTIHSKAVELPVFYEVIKNSILLYCVLYQYFTHVKFSKIISIWKTESVKSSLHFKHFLKFFICKFYYFTFYISLVIISKNVFWITYTFLALQAKSFNWIWTYNQYFSYIFVILKIQLEWNIYPKTKMLYEHN